MSRRTVRSVALAVVMVAAACSSNAQPPKAAATTTTTSTTTSTTTTTVAPGPPSPLTGVPTNAGTAANLGRPALAMKIDNSVQAMPQSGLNDTDVVIELRVEGISRLMAVFHTNDAALVGPTRSARFSDPDVLALFGRPLFGWSGANDRVTRAVYGTPWIVNVNWDKVDRSAYFRRPGRPAPHNLYSKSADLFRYAQPGQAAPAPIFDFVPEGQTGPAVLPIPGVSLSVGGTPSSWVWDAASSSWLRWQYGRKHESEGAGQVNATNVVILETAYKDGKASTAVSTGSGRVTVLTAGGAVEGTWTRADRTQRYTLAATDGSPIALRPGRTWMQLTPGRTVSILSPESASGLTGTPR